MEANLRAQYGTKLDITVANEGVPGSISLQLVNGTDGKHLPWVQTAANSRAQIVIFNFAINDSNFRIGETRQEYRDALNALITGARANGKVPVLEEPNPICRSQQDSDNLGDWVANMRDVAATAGVTLISQYDAIKAMPNWQAMLADCVHPTEALYRIKGERQAEVIGTLLNQYIRQ